MRILFLAHRLPYPPNKGDKIRSFWELSTLSKKHEVDLFCFYDDPHDKAYIGHMESICNRNYIEPLSFLSSRLNALSALSRGLSFSAGYFYSRTMATQIADAIQLNGYDLAFVFGSPMSQYLERQTSLPKVLDMVDVDSEKWEQYAMHSRGFLEWLWKLEGTRLRQWESELVNSFSKTFVCTGAEASLLRSRVHDGQIDVLQNSVDLSYYHPAIVTIPDEIRELQPYIIFTGTMDYFPNIDAVQCFYREILPLVRGRVPNVNFVVAGRNPSYRLRREGAAFGVTFTGNVPDMRPYVKGATIAVAPMRVARGVQNKILEALAMDIPVIASSLAAAALPREIAALITAEDKPESFAGNLIEHLLEPSALTGIRRTALNHYVESLDLATQLETLVSSVGRAGNIRNDQIAELIGMN